MTFQKSQKNQKRTSSLLHIWVFFHFSRKVFMNVIDIAVKDRID